jgi:hypothetical protein
MMRRRAYATLTRPRKRLRAKCCYDVPRSMIVTQLADTRSISMTFDRSLGRRLDMTADSESDLAPPNLADGWPVKPPKDLGMDASVLREIGPRFEAWKEACAPPLQQPPDGYRVCKSFEIEIRSNDLISCNNFQNARYFVRRVYQIRQYHSVAARADLQNPR